MSQAVPFVGYLGLEITEIGEGEATARPARAPRAEQPRRLPARRRPLHRRRDRLGRGLRRRLRRAAWATSRRSPAVAEIAYEKIAHGAITAKATLGIHAAEALATLDEEGKVEFPCEVELTDKDGQRVATATVDWHVRLKSRG